jgi:hypothetical protein
MQWDLGEAVDLDRVEHACRAVAERHELTIQLRARRGAIACHFEVRGPELRAWELRAGANARELDALWRRCGYDGAHRIGIELAVDATEQSLQFDLATGANLLCAHAGVELARELAHELGGVA